MTDAEMIAAYLATKGATKIDTGATAGLTDKQWHKVNRLGKRVNLAEIAAPPLDQSSVTVDALGREWRTNADGEVVSCENR